MTSVLAAQDDKRLWKGDAKDRTHRGREWSFPPAFIKEVANRDQDVAAEPSRWAARRWTSRSTMR
jgi:hypothetical protein